MKIWFEITNSPHINLFSNIIRDLQEEHDVTITCRPLANTVELLELQNFTFDVVGTHYGKNIIKKLFGFPVRVFQLVRHFKKNKPDVAVSQSSFQMPLAARLLNVPCLYMNDNEHAKGNIPSFLCADIIMVPEFLSRKKVHKQFGKDHKIIKYPGVKEGIYLWKTLKNINKKNNKKKVIFFRPEPRTAQYYRGKLNFIDPLLIELKEDYHIIVSPRDSEQKKHFKEDRFAGIKVLDKPMTLIQVIEKCDLFIGAGGTMTREMAVAGIPTISIYQDSLLDVDNYLIQEGLLKHIKNPDKQYIDSYFSDINNKSKDRNVLLKKGEQAETLIFNTILNLGRKNKCIKQGS